MPAGDSEIQEALTRLGELAREGRAARGLSAGEILRRFNVSKTAMGRLETGNWFQHGMSKNMLETIMRKVYEVSDETWAEAEQLFTLVRAHGQGSRTARQGAEPRRTGKSHLRFGVTAAQQENRPYASIDRVEYVEEPGGIVRGTITRIEPPGRRGATWECLGHITPRELHVTFRPADSPSASAQADSSGNMAIQRAASTTKPWYGFYTKLERRGNRPELLTFTYWLTSATDKRLVAGSSSVALLDFDNSLARGWILEPWLDVLAQHRVGAAEIAAERLRARFEAYRQDPADGHDRLAHDAARIYGEALDGVDVSRVRELAEPFVADYVGPEGKLFSSSRELIEGLRERGVRPILVTGAPAEVAEPLVQSLGFEGGYALLLDHDGVRFGSRITHNRGLSTGKNAVCALLVDEQECAIEVAVGDSEADVPLWRAAKVPIRVVTAAEADTEPARAAGERAGAVTVDLGQPLSGAFWNRIPVAPWLDQVAGAALR